MKYKCIRCQTLYHPELEGDLEDAPITGWVCPKCNWHNDLDDLPDDFSPITYLRAGKHVCYPSIEKGDLEEIPEKLKEAILVFLKDPEQLTRHQRQNIHNTLLKKDAKKFKKIGTKYINKAKLASFIQRSDFYI